MATTKKNIKSAPAKSTLIKIAEVVGQVAGGISVKKDQVTEIASHAVDVVKGKIKNLTTKTSSETSAKELQTVAQKVKPVKAASPKKAAVKKAPVAVKDLAKPTIKKSVARPVAQNKSSKDTASKKLVAKESNAKPAGKKTAAAKPVAGAAKKDAKKNKSPVVGW